MTGVDDRVPGQESAWTRWGLIAAGMAVFLVILRFPVLQEGNPLLYMITLAINLIVLSDIHAFRSWRGLSSRRRSTLGIRAVAAGALILWSSLCIFGIVD